MRVSDVTDETFDSLTGSGTVVVAFYMSPDNYFKAVQPELVLPPTPGRRRRRGNREFIRRALASAAWSQSRKIRVVFADCYQCKVAWGRFDIVGYPAFFIIKDGIVIAKTSGVTQGGHKDSYRIARDGFIEWLSQHLSS